MQELALSSDDLFSGLPQKDFTLAFYVVLMPSIIGQDKVSTLRDVETLGGRILEKKAMSLIVPPGNADPQWIRQNGVSFPVDSTDIDVSLNGKYGSTPLEKNAVKI